MTAIVTDFGGMVDKIAGDAVHAFFNAPFALPGHPERAVSCALALLAEAEAVRARHSAGACGLAARGSASKPVRQSSATWGAAENWTTRRTATR